MTSPDLSKLEALARAATPGPWTARASRVRCSGSLGGAGVIGGVTVEWEVARTTNGRPEDGLRGPANTAFIAACSPDVILALCARVRQLEAVVVAAAPE